MFYFTISFRTFKHKVSPQSRKLKLFGIEEQPELIYFIIIKKRDPPQRIDGEIISTSEWIDISFVCNSFELKWLQLYKIWQADYKSTL